LHSKLLHRDIIIIGGGAAGFFSAINIALKKPECSVLILERGKDVLTKVRISGGGRCNVTHAEFIPKELSKNYPRGEKELLGPFHTFMTGDTIAWFEERGVSLKIEEDGRMFPVSNSSLTIIDCFLKEAQQYLIVATGSNPKVWKLLEKLGHSIINAVPSLFTFNSKDVRIKDLMGLSSEASIEVLGAKLRSEGPLLITHWGFSGPGILKLSAWGARELAAMNYCFAIKVNWLLYESQDDVMDVLMGYKHSLAKQSPYTYTQFDLPKRLWQNLLTASRIKEGEKWADLTKNKLQSLSKELTCGVYEIKGKSTFKEEFVTAGGINLKEVNFKTFESKIQSNLYLAGEVLNIDAITGGFNFQNAWTGGHMVADAIVNKLDAKGKKQ